MVQVAGCPTDVITDGYKVAFKEEAVPFGEVADAPPAVNLKRRHWDGQGPSPGSRHAAILQKHLRAGQAQLAKGSSQKGRLQVWQIVGFFFGLCQGSIVAENVHATSLMSNIFCAW
jgi:hypothetical protein